MKIYTCFCYIDLSGNYILMSYGQPNPTLPIANCTKYVLWSASFYSSSFSPLSLTFSTLDGAAYLGFFSSSSTVEQHQHIACNTMSNRNQSSRLKPHATIRGQREAISKGQAQWLLATGPTCVGSRVISVETHVYATTTNFNYLLVNWIWPGEHRHVQAS